MLGRPLAGIWNLKQPVILWSTKALIWRCSQERKWGGGGICRQISDKNCCLYPGEARRRVPRFLQDFPNLVPAAWLPLPSFGSFLEAQSTLAALLGMCRDAASWHCCVWAGNLAGPTHPSVAVSHRCVPFASGGRWHEFIYFYRVNRKQNPKRDVQEEAALCVLISISTQIQLSPAGCYQMETMIILKRKKKKYKYHFARWGGVYLSLHLAEQQTSSV